MKIIFFSISKLEFEKSLFIFTLLITTKMNDEMIAPAQKEKIKFLGEFTEKKIELTDNTRLQEILKKHFSVIKVLCFLLAVSV